MEPKSVVVGRGVVEEEEIEFPVPPSANLYCPICQELFKTPVITSECNHTFCTGCINQVSTGLCPLCRTPIVLHKVHRNLLVDQLIKETLVYCKYRRFGCKESVTLTNKKSHESHCDFRPTKCIHSNRGCKYEGKKSEVEAHVKVCVFDHMKEYLNQLEDSMASMKKLLEKQDSEIKNLKSQLLQQLQAPIQGQILLNPGKQEVKSSPVLPHNALNSGNSTISNNTSAKQAWNVEAIELVGKIGDHERGVTALCYWPQKNYVISGAHDCSIRVWDLTISDEIKEDSSSSAESSPLHGNHHGGELVREAGKLVKILKAHKYTVWSLVIHQSRLYSGSSDGHIICWNLEDFKPLKTLTQPGKVYCLKIVGNSLFSAGSDRIIRVWNLSTFQCEKEIQGHKECVWQLVLDSSALPHPPSALLHPSSLPSSSTPALLYTGSDDMTIKVWNLETFECVRSIAQEHHSKVLSLAVGCGYICMGSDDCKIKIWSSVTYEYIKSLTEHSWEVWQLLIDGSGYLFSGSFDHTIKIWDLSTLTCVKTLQAHKGYVHSLALGPCQLFSGSGDKTLKLWRAPRPHPTTPSTPPPSSS